ncbi:hypothetical protein [Acidithiobacillus marinus]|uniref:hypothetical protein n=1 Tax=Acidithiobacillus marinus TaxID=187490 RepID=UPI00155203AC|nr:hypothetical protein [Acidithiobacillus marinus]
MSHTHTILVLILVGLWVYVAILESVKIFSASYSIGFWDACFGDARKDPAPGKIPAPLNQIAAKYVAEVYGDAHLPRWLRRLQAIVTAIWVVGLYGFLFAVLVSESRHLQPLQLSLFFGYMLFFLLSGLLGLIGAAMTRRAKIRLWLRPRAENAVQTIRASVEWSSIVGLLQSLKPEYPVWWPYAQGKGDFLRQIWRVLKLAVPVAMGVIAFFHAGNHWDFGSYQAWLEKLLMVLAFAVEWQMLAACLIHWGDWEGTKLSTNDTFPLHILLKDIQGLRIEGVS